MVLGLAGRVATGVRAVCDGFDSSLVERGGRKKSHPGLIVFHGRIEEEWLPGISSLQ